MINYYVPVMIMNAIINEAESCLVSFSVCFIIDYIYTYPGLRIGLVNTNQHLQSTLYLRIRISVTLPSNSLWQYLPQNRVTLLLKKKGIIFS